MNILGGLPAGAIPRAERSGVPLQQFAAASSSARAASAGWDCCDPWDPCCDPWDCDPSASEMALGRQRPVKSMACGGGGGGGGTLCQQCMQNEASNCNRQHSQCLISAAANLAGCMFGCFGVPDCVELCGLLYTRHVTACDDSLTACLKMIPFTCQSYCR